MTDEKELDRLWAIVDQYGLLLSRRRRKRTGTGIRKRKTNGIVFEETKVFRCPVCGATAERTKEQLKNNGEPACWVNKYHGKMAMTYESGMIGRMKSWVR